MASERLIYVSEPTYVTLAQEADDAATMKATTSKLTQVLESSADMSKHQHVTVVTPSMCDMQEPIVTGCDIKVHPETVRIRFE